MISSCEAWPEVAGLPAPAIRPLEYPAIGGIAPADGPDGEPEEASRQQELEARVRELERELEERERGFASALEAVRLEAGEAGKRLERGEQASRVAAAADALREALEGFTAGRDRYLAQVEREVVRLALAIAARILHREALMDPLLLSGAVRVALGQLSETTEVRLRVPAAEQELWSEMLRLMPNLPLRPGVVPDESITAGECVLETHLGSVDLGVKSQLAEIERGFFDLLEQREKQGAGQGAQGSEQSSAEPGAGEGALGA